MARRLILAAIGCLLLSGCAVQRSLMASFAEQAIRLSGSKHNLSDSAKVYAALGADSLRFKAPARPGHGCRLETAQIRVGRNSYPLYRLHPRRVSSPEKVVLYLHGGAYVHEIISYQWKMVTDIAKRSGVEVYVPRYPLAPAHTFARTYELLDELYSLLLTIYEPENIIFLGDSAGGGLAVAYCQTLVEKGAPLPGKLVLLSPWVDLTMSTPGIGQFESSDPMLSRSGLLVYARAWAGEDYSAYSSPPEADSKLRDPQLSPIYGEMRGLPQTHLFAGTREILLPDALKFYSLLKDADVPSMLYLGHGCNHVYAAFPSKEGKTARKTIARLIAE